MAARTLFGGAAVGAGLSAADRPPPGPAAAVQTGRRLPQPMAAPRDGSPADEGSLQGFLDAAASTGVDDSGLAPSSTASPVEGGDEEPEELLRYTAGPEPSALAAGTLLHQRLAAEAPRDFRPRASSSTVFSRAFGLVVFFFYLII